MSKPIKLHPTQKPCKRPDGTPCRYLSKELAPVCGKRGECEGWKG